MTYKVHGYSSKENCISECLNNFTEIHGFIIASNVIKRSKYENSSLKIIPEFLRTMQNGNSQVSTEFLKKMMEDQKHPDKVAIFDKLIKLLPSYQNHWKYCMDLCKRPDCVTASHFLCPDG